ncbi:MAG TPA: malonyl-CoA synthase [Azospirillaceae bacterium]|nr:malonyl-CoA synthase [Azospirillaceae bacterium]
MTENLFDLFQSRFPADRSRPFIETDRGRAYSYADLEDISGRYARLMADLGVKPGHRVAVQVEKSPEAVFLYLACMRLGAILLPLNTAYQDDEVEFFLSDAEPSCVVGRPAKETGLRVLADKLGVPTVLTLADDGQGGTLVTRSQGLDPAFPTSARGGNDTAAILYSSGTTGRPKGAMMSHTNLGSNALTLHKIWGWRADDVLLHALPIFHTHGLFVAINCVLLNGSAMLFLPKFDADTVVRLLPRATVFMGVPTFYTRLLSMPSFTKDACRTVRLFISGSAPLLAETHRAFAERTGHAILERYGMTETGMLTSNPLDGDRIAGTVGFPLPDVEVRVAAEDGQILRQGEIGVIEVRGPNVFSGYWKLPEKNKTEFRADGFFITGDIGMVDERGYVHIVGRAKDMIISGGYNVYPKEIEDQIDRIDGVLESAVVGMPHPDFGEAGLAVIVRKPGFDATPTADQVVQVLRGKLANYKVPKQIVFVPVLPRNTMGKVQKNVLRADFSDAWATNFRKA